MLRMDLPPLLCYNTTKVVILVNDEFELIDLMFESKPIEVFQKLFTENQENFDWSELLYMCYCEESYESVGGDEGYLDNPPIHHERLKYLETLIKFLEDNGIKAE